jgi:hypothetical protein
VRFNIFLCFFLRMRLRRFLISEPIRSGEATGAERAGASRSTGHDDGMISRALALLVAVTVTVASTAALAVTAPPAGADLPVLVERTRPGPLGALGVVGDSVTQGTLGWLVNDLAAQGWGPLRLYAAPGVRIAPDDPGFAIPVVQQWRAGGFDPRVWIVGLGADDVGIYGTNANRARAAIRWMLDVVGPGREVVWPNITYPDRARQNTWNAALVAVAAERPNLHVFDWAGVVAQHPDWLEPDGVHLKFPRYQDRARLLASAALLLGRAQRTTSAPARTAAVGPPSALVPFTPRRALDTRAGGLSLRAGETRLVALARFVPAGATAAVVNLTVDGPRGDGFLTAFACGTGRPMVSSLNYRAGERRGAAVIAGVDTARRLCVYSYAATSLVVDVQGAFSPSATQRFTPLSPRRLLDTRARGIVGDGGVVRIAIPGANATPPTAVAVNLTAVGAAAEGYLAAWPCDARAPLVSNVNYRPVAPVANLAVVALGRSRQLCVRTLRRANVLVDLMGVFGASGLRFQAARPVRLLDTRVGTGGWRGAPASLQAVDVSARAVRGVPVGATALVGTATAVYPWGAGFVTTWPCAVSRPTTSTLNYGHQEVVANAAVVALGADRRACLATYVPGHLLFDLTGWFAP